VIQQFPGYWLQKRLIAIHLILWVSVAANSGSLFIRLKPRSQRQLGADEIVQNLRTKLATVPGIQVFLQNPPAIPIGAQQTTGLYQVALQSSDVNPLQEYVPQLVLKMKEMPELQDVNSDLQFASEIQIDIDRDKASTYGITAEQIENTKYQPSMQPPMNIR
jgi:hydrophobic/amphiphilic exporter-1 (mainly G- bacteria), HAE1 family